MGEAIGITFTGEAMVQEVRRQPVLQLADESVSCVIGETHLRLACNAAVSSGGLGCNGLALERYKKRYAEIHTSAGGLMACLVVCVM